MVLWHQSKTEEGKNKERQWEKVMTWYKNVIHVSSFLPSICCVVAITFVSYNKERE